MKNFWRNIHLWLGLAAGLIFFIECLSGTLLVFEDEITFLLHKERYQVPEIGKMLPLDELIKSVKTKHSNAIIKGVKVNSELNKTVEFSIGIKEKKELNVAIPTKVKGAENQRRAPGKLIFVNPYTGMVTAELDPQAKTFFTFMLRVHQSLLADKVGKSILGISTFVVFIILITGIILWFPKKRKQLKAKLKIKTDGSWKRLNHDLHIVLGFYCTIFIVILLVTSLAWSFKWANDALYIITGSKPGFPEKPKSTVLPEKQKTISYAFALKKAKEKFPDAPYWSISIPKAADEAVAVTMGSNDALHNNGFDNLSLDKYTGAVLLSTRLKDMPGGWQLRRYMKPIHTGAIGGLSTKLLAFFVSLVSAGFPITGVILWLNRIRKKAPKQKVTTTQ
ncbi:PepSY-associated TM helix domain-containing protein [Pedobacter aquatilis]|uniref:PepSY-associated TM helix domain-containing protein n=1 Tax=Pedobacter aquatilis TaxID=351343 RepID=UPI00292FAE45|nr:PepSY-associated TM helix domain-containing protein [Pedobacter aquatilis]